MRYLRIMVLNARFYAIYYKSCLIRLVISFIIDLKYINHDTEWFILKRLFNALRKNHCKLSDILRLHNRIKYGEEPN